MRSSVSMFNLCCVLAIASSLELRAQQTPVPYANGSSAESPAPTLQAVAPGLGALHGKDPTSGISYTRIFLTAGTPPLAPPAGTGHSLTPPDLQQPTLTAQCTQEASGKLRFEVFANFGGVTDPAFYPPWHSAPQDIHPPRTGKATITLNFVGYRKYPAYKQQFESTLVPAGQYRYTPPGNNSSNLEEFAWFLQVLRALPTLRLTLGDKTVDFLVTPWLAQLAKEPLCKASGF